MNHDRVRSCCGEWEFLEAANDPSSPANEFIIYSASQNGAEFYVDLASVEPNAVPEPGALSGFLSLVIGSIIKRKLSSQTQKTASTSNSL